MRGSSGSDWHGASRLCLTLHSQYAHAFALRACALFLLVTAMRSDLVTTTDYEAAFTDADIALLVGARPRGKGMLRSDLLQVGFRTVHARVAFVARAVSPTVTNPRPQANAAIFEGQGKAIDEFAKKTVKVLVVGNPANTNALITMTNAPSIPRWVACRVHEMSECGGVWRHRVVVVCHENDKTMAVQAELLRADAPGPKPWHRPAGWHAGRARY